MHESGFSVQPLREIETWQCDISLGTETTSWLRESSRVFGPGLAKVVIFGKLQQNKGSPVATTAHRRLEVAQRSSHIDHVSGMPQVKVTPLPGWILVPVVD